MAICNLCQINTADKKNSHIVPKFFSKTMLKQADGKHLGYDVSFAYGESSLKEEKIQDIHKEDDVLCSGCESKLSNLETIFANQIYSRLKLVDRDQLQRIDEVYFCSITTSKIQEIKLLIYSVAWRANIARKAYPESFLDENTAEKFRKLINKEIVEDDFEIKIIYCPDSEPNDNFINVLQNDSKSIMFLNEMLIIINFKNSQGISHSPLAIRSSDNNCPVIFLPKEGFIAIQKHFFADSIKWILGI